MYIYIYIYPSLVSAARGIRYFSYFPGLGARRFLGRMLAHRSRLWRQIRAQAWDRLRASINWRHSTCTLRNLRWVGITPRGAGPIAGIKRL